MTQNETLEELARKCNKARQKVIDWMNEEAKKGRLRTNAQAPAWAEYEAAEIALAAALDAVK